MDTRLQLLHRAIEASPEAAVNFVLRGEYWLQQDQIEKAMQDFEEAVGLAQVERESSDWGYIQQAIIDRARYGLRMAKTLIT